MKPWKEVEADPQFQSLEPEQQLAAQLQYFDEVVAPQVEQTDLGNAKNQFLSEFGRGPGLASAMGTSLTKEYGNTLVNRTLKGVGALASILPGGEEVGAKAAELGTEFERQTASDFPISPEMTERFPVKAAGAVGQALGYATSTLVSGGLGAGPQTARAVGLGMAGTAGAGSGYDIAEQYGVTSPWERAALIAGGGAIEAGAEAFGGFGSKRGTEMLLGRMKSATMPGSAFGRAGKTIGSEALEEPVAGQFQDWLTGAIVEEDPARPGFATNGQPLPADTLTIENLKNRLEEAALGAVGGTVFAGAEAIGARTDIDQALAMRIEARQAIKDLEGKGQNLSTEEAADLTRLQAEDQNIGSWLERKGLERIQPVLDEMASNPEAHAETLAKAAESRGDAQSAAFWRSEQGVAEIEGGAVQYQALIDNLGMVEQDPEATPEEKVQAGKAVENHALNSLINPLQKKKQEQAINQTVDQRIQTLKKKVEAVSEPKPTAPNPSVGVVAPIVAQTTAQVQGLSPELDQKLDVLNQKLAELQTTPAPVAAQPAPVQSQNTTESLLDEDAARSEENASVRDAEGGTDREATRQKFAAKAKELGITTDELATRVAAENVAAAEAVAKTLHDGDIIEWENDNGVPQKYEVEIDPMTGKKVLRNRVEGSPAEGHVRGVNANAVGEMASGKKRGTLKITRKGATKVAPAPVQPPAPTEPPTIQPSSPASKVQSPKARGPRKITTNLRVSGREAENARRKFADIGGNVRIATVEELAQDPVFKAFWMSSAKNPTEEGWQKYIASELPKAEGFNDDGSGRPVIIPSQVAVYSTDVARAKALGMTSGEAAALRVMLHENWHGVESWLKNSPAKDVQELRQRYDSLMAEIPDDQMDSLAQRRYGELSNWREDEHSARILRSEVMAERRESARISGQPDSLVDRFMAWLRDVWMKITGAKQEPTKDELEELFQAWKRAQTAPAQTTATPKAGELQLSTAEADSTYLAAVARGDMETAQRMVDEAAKKAGYNERGWHFSRTGKFTVWDGGKSNYPAFYAAKSRGSAEKMAQGKDGEIMPVFLKSQNPASEGKQILSSSFLAPEVVSQLKGLGFDSAVGGKDFKLGEEIAVFDPNQIKSADPVTYDAQGNPELAGTKASNLLRGDKDSVVKKGVLPRIRESKIIDPIVEAIPVNVVNMLGSKERASEVLLHNPSVLQDLLSSNPDSFVGLPAWARFRDETMGVVTGTRAELRRMASSQPASLNREMFSALDALQNNLIALIGNLSSKGVGSAGNITPIHLSEGSIAFGGPVARSGAKSPLTDSNKLLTFQKLGSTDFTRALDFHAKQDKSGTGTTQGIKIVPLSQRFNPQSKDIRYSLPEASPEGAQHRLQAIVDYFAYIASPVRAEGMDATKATKDGRVWIGDDKAPVEYYRYGTTEAGQEQAAKDAIDILSQESLDGLSPTLGNQILAYVTIEKPVYGLPYSPRLAVNMVKALMVNNYQRNLLAIDPQELRQAHQTLGSGFGAGLQATKGVYGQMQEMSDKVNEVSSKNEKEAGIDDPKKFADSIKSDVADETKAQVPLLTPEVRAPLMEAAQNDVDERFPMAMRFLGEENAQTYADIEGWLAEIEELLARRNEMTEGPSGNVAASRPELPKNLALAQIDEMLADRKKKIENGLKALKVVMEGKDPIEQAKKVVRKRRKQAEQEKAETTDNATFKDWVMGKESADIGTFEDEVVKYIDGNSFNRPAFTALLTNKFENADPNFIAGVVNRVADLLDGVATEEGIEADQKKAPNYDARSKRIVAKSLGNKVEEKIKDPLNELTKKRLKEEIGATEFQAGVTKLGVTPDTAFALSQKVDEDIAARKAVREANKSKAEREKGQKEADALIDNLGRQFSDTLSFDKKSAESAFKALVREYSTAKDAMPDDQFHARTEALMIPKEKSGTLLAMLKEGRRRKDAVDTAKELQKKAHERKLELEKNERETTAAWNALAKQLSDTPSFTSSQKSEVAALIEKYKNKRIGERELEDGLLKLNVTQSTASGISAALQENRRRQDVVDKAKKAQKDEEDARLKNEREVKAKLESIAKDLSDTPSLSAKQKSEVTLLIEKYKKGTIDAGKLEEELKKLNVSPSTASSYVKALEENKKRESAVEYEREAERAEKKIQSEIDRLAKDLSDTVASNAKQAPSEIRKLVEEFKNFAINEKELRDGLAKLRMKQPSIDKLLQLLQVNRQRQVLLTWNTIRQNVLKARERAIQKVKKAMEAKNPKKAANISKFARLLLEASNSGILDSDVVRTAFSQAYNLHDLTPARLKELGELLQKINGLPEGMVKETFLNEFNFLLNEVAPTASFVQFSHLALMGYILGGANTMAMQLTGVGRFINPLSGTLEMLMSGPGTPMQKIGRTMRNFFPVWFAGMKEVYNNFSQVRAGMSGLLDSQPYGVGALISDLASTKVRETSMAWTAWGQINKARFDAPKILEKMGLGTAFKRLTMYPAWMASRSFQVIRGFESLVAGADMNIRFRVQMATARMQADPKLDFRAAWKQVSEAMGDKTSEIYKKAREQAADDVANKRISKHSEKQQVVQLVQNALEKRWGSLENRHRQMAALLNYKTDPLTPLGAGLYNLMNKALQSDQRVLRYSRFGFLFARFFTNAIESAWSRTPLGGLTALMLPKSKDKLDPREERITQIFGSLSAYRDERIARSISGTATMSFLGMLMVLALLDYDPEDDEPPLFWITGEPLGAFGKKSAMEAGGWYKSQTLYLGPLRINYVNASPELAMALSAVGGLADRFMYDRLLTYKLNQSTNEYEKDDFQTYGKPVLESLAAPLSRSTFRSFYDAIDAGFNGDFKKLTRLLSNPVVGTAVALSPAAIIPSFKSFEKIERVQDQPRSPRNAAQALAASIPFTDAGEPLVTPFGEPLSPFPFFSLLSNTQEVSPERGRAARLLADLGIDHRGPETEYLGWDLSEIAYDGDTYLLDETQRDRVLKDIGRMLANSINSESKELRSLLKEKEGRQKVRSRVSKMAKDAKAEALLSFKPVR
jgi:hypothetical protein